MSNDAIPSCLPVLTPCIGVCRLDARGYCKGCLRTSEEIGRWAAMPDVERLHVMQEILPARKAC